jgi:hypothetical protein
LNNFTATDQHNLLAMRGNPSVLSDFKALHPAWKTAGRNISLCSKIGETVSALVISTDYNYKAVDLYNKLTNDLSEQTDGNLSLQGSQEPKVLNTPGE